MKYLKVAMADAKHHLNFRAKFFLDLTVSVKGALSCLTSHV